MPRALSVLGLVVAAPIFSTGVGVTLNSSTGGSDFGPSL